MISCHDQVVKRRECDDGLCLLGDEKQEQWDKKGEQRDKESGQEGLDHFGLPCVFIQVTFLRGDIKNT